MRYLAKASIILYVVSALVSGCAMCKNEEVERVPSPNRRHDAVVFRRDCGATTGFSMHMSILSHGGAPPAGGGNALTIDSNHGLASDLVRVSWDSTDTIRVMFDKRARVFMKEKDVSVNTGGIERYFSPQQATSVHVIYHVQ